MDRKNRVKMLINKLWKTRQIQAAFGMRRIFTRLFGISRSLEPRRNALCPDGIHRVAVNYPENC